MEIIPTCGVVTIHFNHIHILVHIIHVHFLSSLSTCLSVCLSSKSKRWFSQPMDITKPHSDALHRDQPGKGRSVCVTSQEACFLHTHLGPCLAKLSHGEEGKGTHQTRDTSQRRDSHCMGPILPYSPAPATDSPGGSVPTPRPLTLVHSVPLSPRRAACPALLPRTIWGLGAGCA